MSELQEAVDALTITKADRLQYTGYQLCDELIRMKKVMQWMQKKTSELRKS